jgi:hypothetical protein
MNVNSSRPVEEVAKIAKILGISEASVKWLENSGHLPREWDLRQVDIKTVTNYTRFCTIGS